VREQKEDNSECIAVFLVTFYGINAAVFMFNKKLQQFIPSIWKINKNGLL
jgi:hypothetical protein